MGYCPVCGAPVSPGQSFCGRCGSATSPSPSTLTPAPQYVDERSAGSPIAGFWWRVLAFVLDEVALDLVLYLSLRDANLTFKEQAVFSVVANFLYFALLIGFAQGRTLGMMICRMRVVNATDQGPVTFSQAILRALFYSVLLLVASLYNYHAPRSTSHLTTKQAEVVVRHGLTYFGLSVPHFLDLLWAAWDKRRQTLHDKFARTVVIRTR